MLNYFWKSLCIITLGLTVAFSAQADPSKRAEVHLLKSECASEAYVNALEAEANDFTEALLLSVSTEVSPAKLKGTSDCLLECGDDKDECVTEADDTRDFCYDGCDGGEGWEWLCRRECDLAHGVDVSGCYTRFYACSAGCWTKVSAKKPSSKVQKVELKR